MKTQRHHILIGSTEAAQLSSGFIKFIEEIFLPIAKQDTKQFQCWTKFKEIIDPFNRSIDLIKIENFLITLTPKSKVDQENKPPLPFLQKSKEIINTPIKEFINLPIQEQQPHSIIQDKSLQIKEIVEKITKQFHSNNTHLDILLKMNDASFSNKSKIENIQTNQIVQPSRRIEYKRRNTEYYTQKLLTAAL